MPQRCFVVRRDLSQLFGGLSCLRHVVGRQRDLDLSREQACPCQRQRLIGECRPDRRASRDRAPSRELQERQPGLRIVPTLMSLCERLFGPVEVAHPETDLPDLMETHARDRQLPERDQLLHRVASLDLRVSERSAEADDLRPTYPTMAREAADRLALAPASRRLGPLARRACSPRGRGTRRSSCSRRTRSRVG